jgi:hypothetical protein
VGANGATAVRWKPCEKLLPLNLLFVPVGPLGSVRTHRLFFIVVPHIIQAQQKINNGVTPGETWYLHYSCGASAQCASANGGATGIRGTTYSSEADCLVDGPKTGFVEQPAPGQAGWFCTTESDPHAI